MHKFIVPIEVKSQNVTMRTHWARLAKENRKALFLVAHYARGIDRATQKRRVVMLCYRKRLILDRANLVGGAKGLVDALVRNKLLVDDSDEWCEIEYAQKKLDEIPDEIVMRFGRVPLVEISLEDAP